MVLRRILRVHKIVISDMDKSEKWWNKASVIISFAGVIISSTVSILALTHSCDANRSSENANKTAQESNNIAKKANEHSEEANRIAKNASDTANVIAKKMLEIEIGKEIQEILSQANEAFEKRNYDDAYNKYKEYKKYHPDDKTGGNKFKALSDSELAINPNSERGKLYLQWAEELLK